MERIAPPLALQSGHSVRAARHFPSITVCFLAIIPGVHRVLPLIQPLVRHSADTGLTKDLFQPPLLLPYHCRPQDTLDHDQRQSSPCRGYAARRLSGYGTSKTDLGVQAKSGKGPRGSGEKRACPFRHTAPSLPWRAWRGCRGSLSARGFRRMAH